MKKKYYIGDPEWEKILKINEEGDDRVMYLSGGLPLGSGDQGVFISLQEKMNKFWKELGRKEHFDPDTIEPINDREFYAKAE